MMVPVSTASAATVPPPPLAAASASDGPTSARLTVEQVYQGYFDFVWCAARRLGVPPASLDDVVQDVFVVVHRRLPDFEGRSSVKTWLFGIVLRISRDHRRAVRRKGGLAPLDEGMADGRPSPLEATVQSEALQRIHDLLGELDDAKREVWIMAEFEQMTVPEIAEVLGINHNTVYSRLRAARIAFAEAWARRTGGPHE
jgi:RNA polymerase sigma-70 factor (ECF subfamily)